ncbi:hypothetical protein [Streptomyces sp900116325]|uniref:hypothetical protein n=1 Tax=Streptomyces sp. 900116325 TaxID=3154295 RepID=UPI003316A582
MPVAAARPIALRAAERERLKKMAHGRKTEYRPRSRANATAQPFQWWFTTSDLDDLLARLDRHTADYQEESSFRLAA